MNGRERLTAIFDNREADRPALKLWGFLPGEAQLHPAYEPVSNLAAAITDWMPGTASPFHIHLGTAVNRLAEKARQPGPSDDWQDRVTVWHTPAGDLRSVYRESTKGMPGYDQEHFVKDERDLVSLLSVPYEPYPFRLDTYHDLNRQIGDHGICLYFLDHAMYALQRVIGSENFAIMSVECRDTLMELIHAYSQRILREANCVFDAGLRPVFGWVGPELCIPPLMSPGDFEEMVVAVDKPLCDLIHERGGRVWVHCHGSVGKLIGRFIHMGVDVLNPLEPPPMGDAVLSDIVAAYGSRIGLEGNIETHELWSAESSRVAELVRQAVRDGGKSGRFILCPSAGYMEFPNPTERYINNLMTFLQTGYEEACLFCQHG